MNFKTGLYIALIVTATAGITWLAVNRYCLYVIPAAAVLLTGLAGVIRQYRSFNQNILLLLDALNNGDYSFRFSETGLPASKKEINRVMNRIREILVNAREEVIENEKFLSTIVETAPVGLIIMDEQGGITAVNRTALQWFGLLSLSHVNQLGRVNETYPGKFAGLRPGDSLQLTVVNEREELQISLKATEVIIRQRVMRLMSLNSIGNELESKEIESWIRLIRVMTHEIMNSIAPITSLSDTMLGVLRSNPAYTEHLQKNLMEAFETINATANGLSTFVESYRKFTSIPQPVVNPFLVKELVAQTVNLHAHLAIERNIRMQTMPMVDIRLNVDRNLIMQALTNLLKNALEAVNDNGEIRIGFTKRQDGETVIEIANTGQPIPKDILPFIFVPFFTTREGGSGIGLSVSRYIMRLHGGNLFHSVSPDGLTVFSMVFPC